LQSNSLLGSVTHKANHEAGRNDVNSVPLFMTVYFIREHHAPKNQMQLIRALNSFTILLNDGNCGGGNGGGAGV